MTHYEKLATMIFRLIGILLLLYSSLFLVSAYIFLLPIGNSNMIWLGFSPYLAGGVILFMFSKLLAKLVCLGLGKSDER